jgi:hypothetical protein
MKGKLEATKKRFSGKPPAENYLAPLSTTGGRNGRTST